MNLIDELLMVRSEIRAVIPLIRSVAATFHVPALDAQADRLQLVLDDPKAVWDDPADPPPAHPRHGGSSSYTVNGPRAIRNPRGGEV